MLSLKVPKGGFIRIGRTIRVHVSRGDRGHWHLSIEAPDELAVTHGGVSDAEHERRQLARDVLHEEKAAEGECSSST